jgi:hypothetical protein
VVIVTVAGEPAPEGDTRPISLCASAHFHISVTKRSLDRSPRKRQQRAIRPGAVGSILRQEDFFQMRAVSFTGGAWVGRVVEPNIRSGLSGSGAAHGPLYEIRRETEYPAEFPCDFATLYIPKHIEFPKNATTEAKIFRYGKEAAGGYSSWDCAEIKIGEEENSPIPERRSYQNRMPL